MIGYDRIGIEMASLEGMGDGTCRRGETYMHILREVARRQVGTRVAEVTASRRRHFLSLHY